MKKIIACFLTALSCCPLSAQESEPQGGGFFSPEPTACLSLEEHEAISTMLMERIEEMKADGILPQDWGTNRPEAGVFQWPLGKASNNQFHKFYGISNFVDHAPAHGVLQDYNCGERTYDLVSGYNHSGTDIYIWPFPQIMQDSMQVQVLAADGGTIITKLDGNYDKNCAMGNAQWNAVYIAHNDGTIGWYGHMKTGSLTTKAANQSVTVGEVLGTVGSSGSSSGPHLHFEVRDAANNMLDPFAGPCQTTNPSLWANQQLYRLPGIYHVSTGLKSVVYPSCPQREIPNDTLYFKTGDTIYFTIFFRDHLKDSTAHYIIYNPQNQVHQTWTYSPTTTYNASYRYWSRIINASWPSGQYKFEVRFQGDTATHNFFVNAPNSIAGFAPEAPYFLSPSPGKDAFDIHGIDNRPLGGIYCRITNALGATVFEKRGLDSRRIELDVPTGIYFVELYDHSGWRVNMKWQRL